MVIGRLPPISPRDELHALRKLSDERKAQAQTAFLDFLRGYSRNPLMLETAAPAITALKRMAPLLQKNLGENFLGLALGGSLIRGLGSVRSSDVDYFVYVRGSNGQRLERARDEAENLLAAEGLTACDQNPFFLLDKMPPLSHLPALGYFSNHFIFQADPGKLKAAVLAWFETVVRFVGLGKTQLLAQMREDHAHLTGNHPESVVKKYLENRVREIIPEETAHNLSCDEAFVQRLIELAGPYIRERAKMFPFPAEIEDVFNGQPH